MRVPSICMAIRNARWRGGIKSSTETLVRGGEGGALGTPVKHDERRRDFSADTSRSPLPSMQVRSARHETYPHTPDGITVGESCPPPNGGWMTVAGAVGYAPICRRRGLRSPRHHGHMDPNKEVFMRNPTPDALAESEDVTLRSRHPHDAHGGGQTRVHPRQTSPLSHSSRTVLPNAGKDNYVFQHGEFYEVN